MNTSPLPVLHPINQNLPAQIHQSVLENDQENNRLIEGLLQQILKGKEIVNSKLLGKVLRLIDSRLTMKYTATVALLSNYLHSIIQIYLQKRISIPMKIKSLEVATRILKYRKYCLDVVIPWEQFWSAIFTISTRSSKDQSIASEGLNMKLFESLTNFVHEARHYFSTESHQQILNEGMKLLEDLRNPLSFFGVQMLVLLLPTSLPSSTYEEIIPKWIELFTKIADNDAWDCCILTLLCRARKYLTTFNWITLLPLLQVKTKSLLQFPVTKGVQSRVNAYPNTFPPYISALRVSPMDYRKTALKKISKLMYLVCYTGEIVPATPCTITPPIQARDLSIIGMNQSAEIHTGAKELIQFLQIHRTFFYPSNTGAWTADIGYFLLCLTNEIGQHLGQSLLRSTTAIELSKLDSSTSTSTTNSTTSTFSEFQSNSFKKNLQDCNTHSSPTIHQLTIKYLCGALTSIVLEGLYGKSPFLIQSCNFCLRNICAVEPSLGHVILPFLLASLHPNAVNQSHMAPSSMTAITNIIKPLLYPEPIVLNYLEELLQLSLAGIDPNDSHKTMTTLAMYNSIFSWIPNSTIDEENEEENCHLNPTIHHELDQTLPPHYLELTNGIPACSSERYSLLFAENISNVIRLWYPKYLEKIFLLLNSKEQTNDSKASRQPSPLVPYIEESYYEIISSLSSKLRLNVMNMVIDYSNSSHATNAVKEIGKMIENLVSLDPSSLPMMLDKIIDLDLLTCDGTNEKIAMKIRLIGACLRRACGENILQILNKIKFLFNDDFKHHKEKIIRKAVCKFYKDLLKGLCSFYILPVPPIATDLGWHILGRPNHSKSVHVQWHIPSTEAVQEAANILRLLTSSSMTIVETMLMDENNSIEETTDDQNLSLKKIEEKIVTHLQIIRRCLRGAAELLGDTSSPIQETKLESSSSPPLAAAATGENNFEENDENDGDEDDQEAERNHRNLIETGRTHLLNSLPVEDKVYLETLRYHVVSFLNRVYLHLSSSPSPNVTTTTTSTTTTTPSSILVNLRNNPSIHSVWMKIFGVVVMIRMAILKNVDQVKKWFSLSKRMVKSSTTIYMEKKMKRIHFLTANPSGSQWSLGPNESWNTAIQSYEYWIGHDLASRTVSDRTWIQHIIREKSLSFQSISDEQRKYKVNSEYVVALINLGKICGHEYDEIRSKAIKFFKEISSRFGSSLEMILRPLLSSICNSGIGYSVASGVLSVLSLDLVQKRLCGNSTLTAIFLRSVRTFPILINSVPEPDKREKLANKMSAVFGKFLSNWHHIPFGEWTATHKKAPMARLLIQFLSDFGINNNYDTTENDLQITNLDLAPSSNTATSNTDTALAPAATTADESVVGIGIRQQLYLASSLLIFIGHDDIELPLGLWDWALNTVSKAHGQPIQLVSLSALAKLATIEYRKSIKVSQSSSSSSSSSPTPVTYPSHSLIQNILSTIFNSSSSSLSFLSGLSLSHVHSHGNNSNSAQWSKGVDQMLKNSEYVRNVLPRIETSYCDISIFSSHFQLSNASMIMHLLSLSSNDDNVDIPAMIGNLLQASKLIPSTNEEEIRSANTIRAELFSGIVRFIRQRETSNVKTLSFEQTEPIWKDLLTYLNDNISKISQDFCTDWAEALAFGFSGSPNLPSNLICDMLLRSMQQLFLFSEGGSDSSSPSSSSNETTSTGFAKDTKTLLLMRALLVSDIGAVSRLNNSRFIPKDQKELELDQKSSLIGLSLLNSMTQVASSDLTNSIFLSPYLAIRIELSKLLVRLVDVKSDVIELNDLLKCVLFGTENSQIHDMEESKMTSADADTTTTTTTTTSVATVNSSNAVPKQVDTWKFSCDIACRSLERLSHTSLFHKYESLICPLLNIALEGCGHYELEFSKLCHQVCLKTSEHLKIFISQPRSDDSQFDTLGNIIQLFSKQMNSTSLHVRETVIICLGIIFINNYPLLTNNEKKLCKDIFTSGLHDTKPEVQLLSIVGMTTYLSIKSIDELTTLAASYLKNSDILATREKKKRKQNKEASNSSTSSSNEKPDLIYLTTIKMSACMILLHPYDLPKYLPSLITSFIRHDANPVMKETIMKTIQEFKRTHQDRWNEFQLDFSREQLDDLQGAGAAHYFS